MTLKTRIRRTTQRRRSQRRPRQMYCLRARRSRCIDRRRRFRTKTPTRGVLSTQPLKTACVVTMVRMLPETESFPCVFPASP